MVTISVYDGLRWLMLLKCVWHLQFWRYLLTSLWAHGWLQQSTTEEFVVVGAVSLRTLCWCSRGEFILKISRWSTPKANTRTPVSVDKSRFSFLICFSVDWLKYIKYIVSHTEVDSAFYPPWDGKISISQTAVMLCSWEVNTGLAESNRSLPPGGWLKSPAGWLPVHRDQLRAQRSVTSMGSLIYHIAELRSFRRRVKTYLFQLAYSLSSINYSLLLATRIQPPLTVVRVQK